MCSTTKNRCCTGNGCPGADHAPGRVLKIGRRPGPGRLSQVNANIALQPVWKFICVKDGRWSVWPHQRTHRPKQDRQGAIGFNCMVDHVPERGVFGKRVIACHVFFPVLENGSLCWWLEKKRSAAQRLRQVAFKRRFCYSDREVAAKIDAIGVRPLKPDVVHTRQCQPNIQEGGSWSSTYWRPPLVGGFGCGADTPAGPKNPVPIWRVAVFPFTPYGEGDVRCLASDRPGRCRP